MAGRSMDENGELEPRRQVILLSAGASHSVALLSDSVVCSWGRGEDGQLGHGDSDERNEPTIISGLDHCEITSITCGADHTTAYTRDKNVVWSWGWGDFGRLGHGNSTDLFCPHPIKALNGLPIRQIACGDCHCLAITTDGEVYSWGRNQNGQLGLGTREDALVPQKVTFFEGRPVKMLAAGAEHAAAVTEDGRLYGWGWGRYGNLGLGDRLDRDLPEEVTALQPGPAIAMVACGWRHTIAVDAAGVLYSYGWSKYGQLGHGEFEDKLLPEPVVALKGTLIAQIAGGWRHTLALDSEGMMYAWGWNKFGQVGVGNFEDQNLPQLLSSVTEAIVQVACGWRHSLAISAAGNVYSWGRGTSGQLGHGDCIDRSTPKRLEALSADGQGAQGIQRSPPSPMATSTSHRLERFSVVPSEPAQASSSTSSGNLDILDAACVPASVIKRLRSR
eukprot:TRINITY_DN22878_c0_g1_i1.p1 TRINITY_DN22878_c0_g1~~TRINITY_DN22878_c0_g1_i1.p1  ORF type:complete len:446 (+),score=66.57 TRINITY_DN22878_c0_g1_i1:322-1659(+)